MDTSEYIDLVDMIAHYWDLKTPPRISYEDLRGIGFLALQRAAETHDVTKGNFRSYASLRIRGDIIDEMRKAPEWTKKRGCFAYTVSGDVRVHEDNDSVRILDMIASDCESPRDSILRSERVAQLAEARTHLTKVQKQIVSYYILGYIQQEIAVMLNCSISNICTTLKRATNRMRSYTLTVN